MKQYFFNYLYLLDLTINTIIGGDPRQTLSARMGRNIAEGRCHACRPICAALSWIQKDHCSKAWGGWLEIQKPDKQTTGD